MDLKEFLIDFSENEYILLFVLKKEENELLVFSLYVPISSRRYILVSSNLFPTFEDLIKKS